LGILSKHLGISVKRNVTLPATFGFEDYSQVFKNQFQL